MTTYKVQKGDTLWSIAKRFLGDGNRFKEIQKANGMTDTVIYPDSVLEIPSSTLSTQSDYEKIGKAFEKALNDVDNLKSVQHLYKLIGD